MAAPAGSDPLRQRTELACRAAPRPRQVTSQESPLDVPRPPPSCAGTLPCLTKSRRQAEPAAPSGRAGPRPTTKSGHTCSAASPARSRILRARLSLRWPAGRGRPRRRAPLEFPCSQTSAPSDGVPPLVPPYASIPARLLADRAVLERLPSAPRFLRHRAAGAKAAASTAGTGLVDFVRSSPARCPTTPTADVTSARAHRTPTSPRSGAPFQPAGGRTGPSMVDTPFKSRLSSLGSPSLAS